MRMGLGGIALAAALAVSAPAMAQQMWSDWATPVDEQGSVTLSGELGLLMLEANEYVYAWPGSTYYGSRLIWKSTAPMASGALHATLPDGWTLTAKARVALGGDSYMEDYDWTGPDFAGFDQDDWTHRSQHDDTNLDWFFDGSVLLGYDLPASEGMKINVNGGFKYTDVQWAAYGGRYVYSDLEAGDGCGFRGCVGDFPDGEAGITYRQMLPAVVAGVDTEYTDGPLTLGASGHVGFTFNGTGDDQHWMRDLNFVDHLQPAPLISAELSAQYRVMDGLNVFVAGSAEQVFAGRADTDVRDTALDADEGTEPDSAGADLFSASITAGLKGTF